MSAINNTRTLDRIDQSYTKKYDPLASSYRSSLLKVVIIAAGIFVFLSALAILGSLFPQLALFAPMGLGLKGAIAVLCVSTVVSLR